MTDVEIKNKSTDRDERKTMIDEQYTSRLKRTKLSPVRLKTKRSASKKQPDR